MNVVEQEQDQAIEDFVRQILDEESETKASLDQYEESLADASTVATNGSRTIVEGFVEYRDRKRIRFEGMNFRIVEGVFAGSSMRRIFSLSANALAGKMGQLFIVGQGSRGVVTMVVNGKSVFRSRFILDVSARSPHWRIIGDVKFTSLD